MPALVVAFFLVFIFFAPQAEAQLLCSICADRTLTVPAELKSVVARVSRGIPITCEALENAAPSVLDGTPECESVRMSGKGLCGCPFSQEPPPGKCNLCESGSELTEDQLDIVGQVSFGSFIETCRLYAAASHLHDDGSTNCSAFQATGLAYCGCTPPPDRIGKVCTLCSTGHLISISQRQVVLNAEEGVTCAILAGTTVQLDLGTDACNQFRAAGNRLCGCTTTTGIACTICADEQSLSGKQKDVVVGGVTKTTCRDLEDEAQFMFDKGDALCRVMQATGGSLCGCSAPFDDDEGICRLCGTSTPLPNPSRRIELAQFFGESRKESCGFVEHTVAMSGKDCATDPMRLAAAPLCCGEEEPEEEEKNVDDDCEDFPDDKKVQMFEPDGTSSCSLLAEQTKSVKKFHCKTFRQIKEACPDTCKTCNDDENCTDDESQDIRVFRKVKQNCKWLSRRDDAKRARICSVSPKARKKCPFSCENC